MSELVNEIFKRLDANAEDFDGVIMIARNTLTNQQEKIERQQAEIERLTNELIHMCLTLKERQAEIERLRSAITRALEDSESGKGWGPDVTVCAYLRKAITPET